MVYQSLHCLSEGIIFAIKITNIAIIMGQVEENKELDLMDLMKMFVGWAVTTFKWMASRIFDFLRFNIRYWILLLIFILGGVALTIYKYLPEHHPMDAEFVINLRGVSATDYKDVVESFGQNIDGFDNAYLRNALHLDDTTAAKIKSIKSYLVLDVNGDGLRDKIDYGGGMEKGDTVTQVMKYQLDIKVRTKGCIDFKKFQDQFVAYLSKDTTLQKQCVEYISAHNLELQSISNEITALDSSISNYSGVSLQMKEGKLVFKRSDTEDKVDLFERRTKLLLNIQKQAIPITVGSDVILDADSTGKLVSKYVGSLYVFALVIAFLFNYRKSIVKFVRESKKQEQKD